MGLQLPVEWRADGQHQDQPMCDLQLEVNRHTFLLLDANWFRVSMQVKKVAKSLLRFVLYACKELQTTSLQVFLLWYQCQQELGVVIINKGQGDSDMKEIEVEGDKEKEGVVCHKLEGVKSQMFFRRDGIRLISLTKEKGRKV